MVHNNRIAILGGGPSGLFLYKNLIHGAQSGLEISIFESKTQLGAGMPYSADGANVEHITNVSDHEIPELVTTMEEWVASLSTETLATFGIDRENFNPRKVVPRLLFGKYLSAQFELLKKKADQLKIKTTVYLNSPITDIVDHGDQGKVSVTVAGKDSYSFDQVVICTGHSWPIKHEGNVSGYFDSPYPPSKLMMKCNHAVAIRGSSLTAIDAIRTLARHNGSFENDADGGITFRGDSEAPDFKLVMHSRNGLLPAIRFHQEDPFLGNELLLTDEEIRHNRSLNEGFVSLDYIFDHCFKRYIASRDPGFFAIIKELKMETFVEAVMNMREQQDPFALFQAEYQEAERSIAKRESIYWKEALSALSFSMNYPAKYLSAEDMLRLQTVLMPLISIVIAFVPQSSCKELLALHAAGKLDIIAVGADSDVEANDAGGVIYSYTDDQGDRKTVSYETFVDCIGQPHLHDEDFPFAGLTQAGTISPATLRFRSAENGREALQEGNEAVLVLADGSYVLRVSGIKINDDFQVVDSSGAANNRIYIMAVPYIGGYNPDYSGLDFCEEASGIIAGRIASMESITALDSTDHITDISPISTNAS